MIVAVYALFAYIFQEGLLNLSVSAAPKASITAGATIPRLTGSADAIDGADTNPTDYGQYNAPGGSGAGTGLIGGPLLSNSQAAALVVATQRSTVELGIPCNGCGNSRIPNASANAAANNYFNLMASTNPASYLYQLRAKDGFWATAPQWGGVTARVDGACPLANPTTAEVLQWAANKWGINPLLLYAEATQEGNWDNTTLGDDGCSSGICQIADRNTSFHPEHAFPGFAGAGWMLARENTCFNADFFAAHTYAAFHGLTGECSAGDIGTAIQTWAVGHASGPGAYTKLLYSHITDQRWVSMYFQGKRVPY